MKQSRERNKVPVICDRCGMLCQPGEAEPDEFGIPRRPGWFCTGFFDCCKRRRGRQAVRSHGEDAPVTILHLDAVYSADEAAAILQVHPKTLKLWVREGKMEASLLGGRRRPTLRFTGRAIQKYLDSATKPTAPPVVRPGRPRKVLTFSAELADRACGLR